MSGDFPCSPLAVPPCPRFNQGSAIRVSRFPFKVNDEWCRAVNVRLFFALSSLDSTRLRSAKKLGFAAPIENAKLEKHLRFAQRKNAAAASDGDGRR
jgi:hypothetical protein